MPCELVLVCLEEGDEHEFLFAVEVGPNLNRLGWFRRVEGHCLDVTIGLFVADAVVGLSLGVIRFGSASKTYEPGVFGLDNTLLPLTLRTCVLRGYGTRLKCSTISERCTLISFNRNGLVGTRILSAW